MRTSPLTLVTAKGISTHARKCKKDIGDCVNCQMNLEWFARLPLSVLGQLLAEPQPQKTRFSLGSVVIDRLIERTMQNVRNHRQTPRAARDVHAAMQVMKWYEESGGTI